MGLESNTGFDDPQRLQKIDKLMELGIGDYISLPQLVVVGDQSSGKSSVLEGLTGIPFPRDSTLCTRFATQIVFRRAEKENITVSIIPSASCDPDSEKELKSFKIDGLVKLSSEEFTDILSKACKAMNIPTPDEPAQNGQSTFSESILRVELLGPKHNHLSVIDVPGIFRNMTEGITTSDDISLVRRMVRHFIQNERTIILAVIPANVDIATQEILTMAKEVDPQGYRTLGVITKPDLVDKGAENDILDLVHGRKHLLKLGYCVVRNRGQNEKNASTSERHQKENLFFSSGPFSTIPKYRVGILALHQHLRNLLHDLTQREFPHVKREISQQISQSENELKEMGISRETNEQQRRYLLNLADNFQKVTTQAVEARYNMNDFFTDQTNRLATQIVKMNQNFSQTMHKYGTTVEFNIGKAEENQNYIFNKPYNIKKKFPGIQSETDILKLYPELDEIFYDPPKQVVPNSNNIKTWIEDEYNSCKGFEVGTFAQAIIQLLFKQQTIYWEFLAFSYINNIIFQIHRFCDHLLSHLCPEGRIKANIWSILLEHLLKKYKKAIKCVNVFLNAERKGNMITTNHYFNDNLEKIRNKRLTEEKQKIRDNKSTEENPSKSATGIDNLDSTVILIHDTLKAYYKVALKRFVDNICQVATDYHLISGPNTPLQIFSPIFIGSLSSDQLEMIAAEDEYTIQQRKELAKRINSLNEGKKILA